MDDPAGTLGATRIQVLKQAALRFVELIPAGNAVGLVRFDHDGYPVGDATYPGLAMTLIASDSMADPGRAAARLAVEAHATNPMGATSIGDGVVMARSVLAPVAGYDEKAIVVLTDGIENQPAWIANVLGSIDQRTFAIGLGTESQVSTAGLLALSGASNGYLLLTGHLTAGTDDYFRLTKYFHQILAGVTRTDIVRDPNGLIGPGEMHRIAFQLTEADVQATTVLLTSAPVIDFVLETPAGDILDPGLAAGLGATFEVGTNMEFYRFGLPLPLGAAGAHAGTWHAVLSINDERWKRHMSDDGVGGDPRLRAHGAQYSLSIHAYSNVHMQVRLDQGSLEPGARLSLTASLTEYDVPLANRSVVLADIERPDASRSTVFMPETEPGIFSVDYQTTMPGVYRVLVRAEGRSRRGLPFTREQLRTAAVFRGGDNPLPTDIDHNGRPLFCDLLLCLLEQAEIRAALERQRIDPDVIRKCLELVCRTSVSR
jgi:hypothetical protein